jgi:uncharacterized membrane protein
MENHDDSRFFDAKRLKDLGDGIFAFAMTFLIVTIDVPRTSLERLPAELNRLGPDLLTYILSFFLLAIFWVTNHIQMKNIKRADSRLIWINLLLFLFIVFVPLTSDLYVIYEASPLTALAFNLNFFLIALVFTMQWHHLVANQMHHEEFTQVEIRGRYQICLALLIISFLASGLGLWYPIWSPLIYLLLGFYRLFAKTR